MLRQRTPSRFRSEPEVDPRQDREWKELLKRRKLCKESFDRIQSELKDATMALQKIGSGKPEPSYESATSKRYLSQDRDASPVLNNYNNNNTRDKKSVAFADSSYLGKNGFKDSTPNYESNLVNRYLIQDRDLSPSFANNTSYKKSNNSSVTLVQQKTWSKEHTPNYDVDSSKKYLIKNQDSSPNFINNSRDQILSTSAHQKIRSKEPTPNYDIDFSKKYLIQDRDLSPSFNSASSNNPSLINVTTSSKSKFTNKPSIDDGSYSFRAAKNEKNIFQESNNGINHTPSTSIEKAKLDQNGHKNYQYSNRGVPSRWERINGGGGGAVGVVGVPATAHACELTAKEVGQSISESANVRNFQFKSKTNVEPSDCDDNKTELKRHTILNKNLVTGVSDTKKIIDKSRLLPSLRYHSYDRFVFSDEFSTLFRERYIENVKRAKTVLHPIHLAVAGSHQLLQLAKEKSFEFNINGGPFKASNSIQDPKLALAFTNTKNNFEVTPELKCRTAKAEKANLRVTENLYRATISRKPDTSFQRIDPAGSEYKLDMGVLKIQDIEEMNSIEAGILKASTSEEHLLSSKTDVKEESQESRRPTTEAALPNAQASRNEIEQKTDVPLQNKVEPLQKVGSTFNIPVHLLKRWGTLFKPEQEDSDSDSEYEFEEDDPSSPYHTGTTLDIQMDAECHAILADFVEKMFCQDQTFFKELNKKCLNTSDWMIAEEVLRNPKNKESIGLLEVTLCGQVRQGYYRLFDPDGKDVLVVGRYVDDEKFGTCWKKVEGNGFLVGIDDTNNNLVEGVYLYPDLNCAITGLFENGKLKSGKFGKVVSVCYDDDDEDDAGIPTPKVEILLPDITYTYDPSMSVSISKSPLSRDPYEHQNVYVMNSTVPFAGEGLYAKRFLPAGTLVALFNGIRQRETGFIKKMHEFSDYRIGIGSGEVCLDIPAAYTSLKHYCATTGHKACHSFRPNAGFREFTHPRFGRIMSIFSEQNIYPNEEVFVSYNYRIHQAPEWYQQLYFKHLRENEGLSEEGIYLTVRRIARDHSMTIPIPPPARDSPRFLPCGSCDKHVGYDTCAVSCSVCDLWFHVGCTSLRNEDVVDENEFGHKTAKSTEWKCVGCLKNQTA